MKTRRPKTDAAKPPRFETLDLTIDEYALDREWMEQPKLYLYWSQKLAIAQRESELARREVDIVGAQLERDIRTSPGEYAIEKPTEAAIKAAVLEQRSYKKATRRVIETRHDVAVLQGAVTAIEHRKRALEKLVDLHGRDYFAKPRVPEKHRETVANGSADYRERRLARNAKNRERGNDDD